MLCVGTAGAFLPVCRAQTGSPAAPATPTLAPPAAPAPSPELVLREARRQVDAKQYTQAEATLRGYLQRDASSATISPEALYLLAYVLQRENRPKQSLEVYTRAAAARVPTAEELRLVALDYVLLADYTDAVRWLERATATDPRNAEAWYDLGRARMQQGNFRTAMDALRQSLALRPTDARALDNLGVCLDAENRPDEALDAYARAVKAAEASGHPGEQPFIDYGALLNTRNGFQQALPLLTRATELAPGSSKAFEELSRACTGLGNAMAARQAMERAVALDPKNSRLHFQLGRIYKAAGMQAEAQREFAQSSALYGQTSTK